MTAFIYSHVPSCSNSVLHHKQVEVPLNTAMKLIQLSADKYDTVFSVTRYVSRECHSFHAHIHTHDRTWLCVFSTYIESFERRGRSLRGT